MKRFMLILSVLVIISVVPAGAAVMTGDTRVMTSHTYGGAVGPSTASFKTGSDTLRSATTVAAYEAGRFRGGHAPTLWTVPQLTVRRLTVSSDTVYPGSTETVGVVVKNVGDSTVRIDSTSIRYVHDTHGTVSGDYADTVVAASDVTAHDTTTILLDSTISDTADTGAITLSSSVGASSRHTDQDAGITDRSVTGYWYVSPSGEVVIQWVGYEHDQYTLRDGTDTGITSDTYGLAVTVHNPGVDDARLNPDTADYSIVNERDNRVDSHFTLDDTSSLVVSSSDTETLVYQGTLPDSTNHQTQGVVLGEFEDGSLDAVNDSDTSVAVEVKTDGWLYDTTQLFVQPDQSRAYTLYSVKGSVTADLPRKKYPDGTKFSIVTDTGYMDASTRKCINEADNNTGRAKRYPGLDTSTIAINQTRPPNNDEKAVVTMPYSTDGVPEPERKKLRGYVLNESLCRWKPADTLNDQGLYLARNEVVFDRQGFSVFRALVSPDPATLSDFTVTPNPFRPNDNRDRTGRPYRPGVEGTGVYFNNVPEGTTVEVFDVHGRLVRKLTAPSGGFIQWDVRNGVGEAVASGVYIYRVKHDGSVKTGKFAVVR